MFDWWSEYLIPKFAASFNSLSTLRREGEIDSELKEAANETPAELHVIARCIRIWP